MHFLVSKRKNEVFFALPNLKNMEVMDMDFLILFNIHKFKLSRLTTSRHVLNVGLVSKRSNFKMSNSIKLRKRALSINQCNKKSLTMYICWCIIDSRFSLNSNLFKKQQKSSKIYLTLKLFSYRKDLRYPKSDLNSRKTLELKDLIFKQSHLLVYSKSSNNSEMHKNERFFTNKLIHFNELLKKKKSSHIILSPYSKKGESKRIRKRAFKSKKMKTIRKKDKWLVCF